MLLYVNNSISNMEEDSMTKKGIRVELGVTQSEDDDVLFPRVRQDDAYSESFSIQPREIQVNRRRRPP